MKQETGFALLHRFRGRILISTFPTAYLLNCIFNRGKWVCIVLLRYLFPRTLHQSKCKEAALNFIRFTRDLKRAFASNDLRYLFLFLFLLLKLSGRLNIRSSLRFQDASICPPFSSFLCSKYKIDLERDGFIAVHEKISTS